MKDNAIYVVFSATPTGMGKLIRTATRHSYNHVSLSLDKDIERMYSFARYHRSIPLYGGFVVESILRYAPIAGQVRVKICRIPVEEEQLAYIRNYLERLWNEREEYIYNTPGALISLLHFSLTIPKTHTCATFVHDILSRYSLAGVKSGRCPSIRAMERMLKDYVVYEGEPLVQTQEWGEDDFMQVTTRRYAAYTTARHFGRLAKRVVLGVG